MSLIWDILAGGRVSRHPSGIWDAGMTEGTPPPTHTPPPPGAGTRGAGHLVAAGAGAAGLAGVGSVVGVSPQVGVGRAAQAGARAPFQGVPGGTRGAGSSRLGGAAAAEGRHPPQHVGDVDGVELGHVAGVSPALAARAPVTTATDPPAPAAPPGGGGQPPSSPHRLVVGGALERPREAGGGVFLHDVGVRLLPLGARPRLHRRVGVGVDALRGQGDGGTPPPTPLSPSNRPHAAPPLTTMK